MKLLNNEFEYREWIVKGYLHLDEEFPSVFEPDELEREILRQAPKEFPCLAQIVEGEGGVLPAVCSIHISISDRRVGKAVRHY